MKRLVVGAVSLALGLAAAAGCKKAEEPKPAEKTAPAAPGEPADPKGEPGESGEPGSTAVEPGATPEAAGAEGAEGAPPEKRITGPVATVNGKPIASDEYYAELDKIEKHGAKIPEDRMSRIKENILKRLIEAELVNQAIAKENITVPDDFVAKELGEYKSRFKSDEQFENYLKHGKLTEADIKERIREKRALELLIEKRGAMNVDEAEARDFYEKNKRFYQEKEAVRASHILIKVAQDAPAEEEEKAKKKIEEVQAQLKGGADFETLANEHSEGPSAPKGGDLGFFSRGQMVKPFEDIAFNMKPGDVSEPVKTRFGWHIIRVHEKREEKQKEFDEVKEQIFESLRNKKFFQERRELLEQLRKDAQIEKHVG